MKQWYRNCNRSLSKEARLAKSYVLRICKLLSKLGNRDFSVEMTARFNVYEGHIIDHGKCVWDDITYTCSLSDNGTDEVGMVFWGGFFSRKKYKDAMSRAWISLLDDCIGSSGIDNFNLTYYLNDGVGPKIDLKCNTVGELEKILEKYEV